MAKPTAQRGASIEALKQRMARDPLSRAFLQLAEEYRKSGQFEDAVRVCQEGLARHPTYHTARISLGRTYLEAGDLENARRSLAEVLELAPENHLAGKLLAEVQRRLGDHPGAIETYRSILRHYPGDQEVAALLDDLEGAGGADSVAGDPRPDYLPEDLGAIPGRMTPRSTPGSDPVVGTEDESGPFVGPGAALDPPPASPPSTIGPVEGEDPGRATAVISPTPRPSAAPAAIRPREGAPSSDDEEEAPDALQTNTLAELYLRQGLVDRAIDVYRSMLKVDPGNVRARRRLDEMTSGAAAGVTPSPAGTPTDASGHDSPLATIAPESRGSRPEPESRQPAAVARMRHDDREVDRRRVTIDRLERWLGSIRGPARGASGGPAR